jgi:hypothetical protein
MDLTDVKVVYICPDHNEKYHLRKLHMEQLLNTFGFKNIVHYISSSENYPECLTKAFINILRMNLDDNPLLIIEDDVECTGEKYINIDLNADAIYIGLSIEAGHCTENRDMRRENISAIHCPHNESQVRVINMLATHAIVYISKKYKQAVIDTLTNNLGTKYHSDVLISRIQPNYVVLANKTPVFYQAGKFNSSYHVEHCTNIRL